jgi:hypothetical protein
MTYNFYDNGYNTHTHHFCEVFVLFLSKLDSIVRISNIGVFLSSSRLGNALSSLVRPSHAASAVLDVHIFDVLC